MIKASWMVCKGFLDRLPTDLRESLVSLLPERVRETIKDLPPLLHLDSNRLIWNIFDKMHPSWLVPYIRILAEADLLLVLASLEPDQIQYLVENLKIARPIPKLTSLSRRYLRQIFLENITKHEHLPPAAFLPAHPLIPLLYIENRQLDLLPFYLGLHDLSFEMRHIIATKELKKIFGCLSKQEGGFLNTLLLHQEPLIFKRQFLKEWRGTRDSLYQLVTERGLHRLGHALYNANHHFLWYLTHRFEMHVGTCLLKYRQKSHHSRGESIIIEQVQKILSFLETQEQS